jgi:hypothetical protein
MTEGLKTHKSPNRWFDELFYLSFYSDIRDAVTDGRFRSGFQHYVLAGRAEQRITCHDVKKVLEIRMPGVTIPALLPQIDELSQRLRPVSAVKSLNSTRTLWFMLPTLNPDIMFGGYRCGVELIKHLVNRGNQVKVLTCERGGGNNAEYFQYCYRNSDISTAFSKVEVINRWDLKNPLSIGTNDRFFAYSAWEAHLASRLAGLTDEPRFVFLVQEYEPIFHEHGAHHAIVDDSYNLPHVPIFNSEALRSFFEVNDLGVFSDKNSTACPREYIVIEHVLSKVRAPSRSMLLKKKGSRRLVLYARPEQHASRNLFPLAVLGLRRAIERGTIQGVWEMLGVGALSPGRKVALSGEYELFLQPRTGPDEYARMLSDTDVGIALMYGPHPGLVPFELAKAGARVVTNSFSNRCSEHLRGISENIVPCAPTIEGIATALEEAIHGLDDVDSRLRGANISAPLSWSDVFTDHFFERLSKFC